VDGPRAKAQEHDAIQSKNLVDPSRPCQPMPSEAGNDAE
jgi:hypothetical protein